MTSTTSSAQERTKQAAGTAADEGKHVASVAKDEAQSVASEAVSQARSVVGDAVRNATDQAGEQTRTQRDRLTETLRSLGDDLGRMAEHADSGLAGDLAREVSQRAHTISEHLDGREPGRLDRAKPVEHLRRAAERVLHGVLLVEHHPHEQGERVVGQHLVRGGVAGDVDGHPSPLSRP